MVFGIVHIGIHPDLLVSEVLASVVLKTCLLLIVNYKTDFQVVQNEILSDNGLISRHFKWYIRKILQSMQQSGMGMMD